MIKKCTVCQQDLPLTEFRFDNKARGIRKSRCGPCENRRMRADRAANGEKRRKLDRELYSRSADKVYRNNLRIRYGCTEEQISKITGTAQCDICGRFATGRKLVVDHCHSTGKNRGVLCAQCNAGLGQFQDDPQILQSAIKYIEARGFGFFD